MNNEQDALNVLGGIDDLKLIIQRNFTAPCISCPTQGSLHLLPIHEYIDHVIHFAKTYPPAGNNQVPGASTLVSLMKNGTKEQIDAVAQILRTVKEENYIVNRFEPKLSNAIGELASDKAVNQIGDIRIYTGNAAKLIELKSFKKTTISSMASDVDFVNQFKAYLQNTDITSIDRLEYLFDIRKLVKTQNTEADFETIADALDFIKPKFKEMMQNNYMTIFNNNPNLFNIYNLQNGLPVNTPQRFQTFLSEIDISHSIFNFIKVK